MEIVLCGIHIGHWGRDLGLELGHLLERLAAVEVFTGEGAARRPVDWRLRLSSIEATEVTGSVLDAMARHPRRIAPHLHMPMQSGDDGVLRRMNRWYTAEEYLDACARIRAALERPAFTADVLVGFPGEDDRAFRTTLASARSAGFTRLHVFPFSPRPGTAAARPAELGRPVPPEEVRERRAQLSELAHELEQEYRRGLDGVEDTVVLEGGSGLSGRYQRVRVDPAEIPEGSWPDLLDVRLEVRNADGAPGAEGAAGEVELAGRPLLEEVR